MNEQQKRLQALDARLRVILPEEYKNSYDDVQPVSMGTASLRYGSDGGVAWDEIWGSFCDLAMAGGPPHKGKLLEPGTAEEIAAEPEAYWAVVEEISRGIRMVTLEVTVEPPVRAGWIRVLCPNRVMAGWLARAIVMENVSARLTGDVVEVPAGPQYRVAKEIKNVVTVMAKTCHYYEGHMSWEQQRSMAMLFAGPEGNSPLLQPSRTGEDGVTEMEIAEGKARAAARLGVVTGLATSDLGYQAWVGLEAGSVRAAIWMMRALVVNHVLARREGTLLYVPVDVRADSEAERVAQAVEEVRGLAVTRGVLRARG